MKTYRLKIKGSKTPQYKKVTIENLIAIPNKRCYCFQVPSPRV